MLAGVDIVAWLPRFGRAALLTLMLSAGISLMSTTIGLAAAVLADRQADKARRRVGAALALYSGFFRSVPELIVLFFFFFAMSSWGIDLGPIGSALAAFGLVGVAYDYEVFKGALSAIPKGQGEAARALGLGGWQVYRLVVLPQMIPIARAGWITYAIGTLKRVSIASAVSVSELLYVTKQAIAASNRPFVFLTLTIALYAVLVSPLLYVSDRLDRRTPVA